MMVMVYYSLSLLLQSTPMTVQCSSNDWGAIDFGGGGGGSKRQGKASRCLEELRFGFLLLLLLALVMANG